MGIDERPAWEPAGLLSEQLGRLSAPLLGRLLSGLLARLFFGRSEGEFSQLLSPQLSEQLAEFLAGEPAE
jgi:hypothetical protein